MIEPLESFRHTNNTDIIGIDEVGRGPLAGPVISAAVWIYDDFAACIKKDFPNLIIRDSKKMTEKSRLQAVEWINKQSSDVIKYSIASATVEEIDELNILNAALLSMKRAYELLDLSKKYVLVDGNKAPNLLNTNVKTIVGGDDKILSISIASIIAKVHRDNLMIKLSKKFPPYKWEKNVGYGTKQHLEALEEFGITKHHRKSFSPIAKIQKLYIES